MTRKERVLHAFNHIETDFVPYHVDFTEQAWNMMKDRDGGEAYIKEAGFHLSSTQYWGWPTEMPDRNEHFLDEFGVIWNRSGKDKDIGVVDSPMLMEADISLWHEPKLDEARIRQEYQNLVNNAEDQFVFGGIGFSMFERFWSLCGMENALVFMLEEPTFVHELLDRICEYNLKIIEISGEYPFNGFYFGDDWGQQKGQIMGPSLWREFIKPQMKRMYEKVREQDRYVIQHSCGDIEALFPDLIEMGLNCYQTFQPEIYDIAAVKEKFGKDLCFWGGISTQQLLPFALPEKVKSETERIISIMGKGGGYIAAPTHAIPFDVPVDNVLAMIDVFKNQRTR